MVQNLKVDVIYYNTPSDFEFEFNLGGCCPSRILNSRTSSPAEMLTSLSKAVSRSRIILIIGKVNEDDGLMALVSKAIGIPLTNIDSSEFSVVYPENPVVIKNALPLISNDGILSGCIVESGPQAIIMLPDSKSLRKEICENLVFPYVTALSKTPETDNVIKAEEDEVANETEPTEEVLEEEVVEATEEETTEEIAEEEPGEVSDEEPSEDEVYDENTIEVTETTDENDDEVIFISGEEAQSDLEKAAEEASVIDENYIFTANSAKYEDKSYVSDEEEEEKVPRKKARLSGISIAIIVVLGLLLVVAAALLYIFFYQSASNSIPVLEYAKEIFNFS